MASYSCCPDYYDGDPYDHSSAPYYEPSPSFPLRGSAAYSPDDVEEDPGEQYSLSPYHDSYSSEQYPGSFAYGYNSTCSDHVENPVKDHSLVPCYSSYDSTWAPYQASYYQPVAAPAAAWSRISYSASALSEPKCITLYGESPDYYSVQTQFLISYNVSDFNEPEDREYDPTPYGGGYDIAATYGKPLSPSEETCYPRSDTSPVLPIVLHPPPANDENPPAQVQSTEKEIAVEILPSVDNETNREDGFYDHNENQVVPYQVPSGYGLETVDICESLFGPWPCLTRNYRRAYGNQQDQEEYGHGSYGNQWNDAADYLFGSSYPYGQTMPPGENHVLAYHWHNYQDDPLHQEAKYVFNSWSS